MRKVLRKIIQILDGTPAVYGSTGRGQSMVELALVTPILIILIMGLVEIGWFANNFLILLESSRVGARFGTIQTGDTSPLSWPNQYSVSPNAFPGYYGYTGDPAPDEYSDALRYRRCSEVQDFDELAGFYNLISCVMLQSITPLEFRSPIDDPAGAETEPNGVDDIVISAFSLQTMNLADIPAGAMRNAAATSLIPGIPASQQQVLVVGRYPINANECSVKADGTFQNPPYERDPFDYIQDNDSLGNYILADLTQPDIESNRLYLEVVVGHDEFGDPVFGYDNNVAGNATTWERQRGFSLTGQQYITTLPGCVGSEWSMADVQRLMNLPQFGLSIATDPDKITERQRLPSQGIVLVEMFWEHELLLKNPVFNPVFTVIGEERTTVTVWSVFPVPAVEPRIKYGEG